MFERETTCCFTGNRPEKLNITEKEAKELLCNAVEKAIEKGYTTFITGMADGVDTWSGEIVLTYKNLYPNLRLVCALPYPRFVNASHPIIKSADFVHSVFPAYSPFSYQARNEWMVNHSSLVIALSSGKKGGTENTIRYAEKVGVEVMKLQKEPLFKQLFIKKIYE